MCADVPRVQTGGRLASFPICRRPSPAPRGAPDNFFTRTRKFCPPRASIRVRAGYEAGSKWGYLSALFPALPVSRSDRLVDPAGHAALVGLPGFRSGESQAFFGHVVPAGGRFVRGFPSWGQSFAHFRPMTSPRVTAPLDSRRATGSRPSTIKRHALQKAIGQ